MNKRNFIKTGLLAPFGALVPVGLLANNKTEAENILNGLDTDRVFLYSTQNGVVLNVDFRYEYIKNRRWDVWRRAIRMIQDESPVVFFRFSQGNREIWQPSSVQEIKALLGTEEQYEITQNTRRLQNEKRLYSH